MKLFHEFDRNHVYKLFFTLVLKNEDYNLLDSKIHSYYDERINKGVLFECSSNENGDRNVYHYETSNQYNLQKKNNCPEGVTIIQSNYYYDRDREHGVILCSSNDDEAVSYGICYYYGNNDTWQFKSFNMPFVDIDQEINMFYDGTNQDILLAVGNDLVSLY